jgi:hypothetical protein
VHHGRLDAEHLEQEARDPLEDEHEREHPPGHVPDRVERDEHGGDQQRVERAVELRRMNGQRVLVLHRLAQLRHARRGFGREEA